MTLNLTDFNTLVAVIVSTIAVVLVFSWFRAELEDLFESAIKGWKELRERVLRSLREIRGKSWDAAKNTLEHARPEKIEGDRPPPISRVLITAVILSLIWICAAIADFALTIDRFYNLFGQDEPTWLPDTALLGGTVFLTTLAIYGMVWFDLARMTGPSIIFSNIDDKARKLWTRLSLAGAALTIMGGILLSIALTAAKDSSSPSSGSIAENLFWMTLLAGAYGALFLGHAGLIPFGHAIWVALLGIWCLFLSVIMLVTWVIWAVVHVALAILKFVLTNVLGMAAPLLRRRPQTRASSATLRDPNGLRLVDPEQQELGPTKPGMAVSTTVADPKFEFTFRSDNPAGHLAAFRAEVRTREDELVWDSGSVIVSRGPAAGGTWQFIYGGPVLKKGSPYAVRVQTAENPNGPFSNFSESLQFAVYSAPELLLKPVTVDSERQQVSFDLFYAQAEEARLDGYVFEVFKVDAGEPVLPGHRTNDVGLLPGKLVRDAARNALKFIADQKMALGPVRIGTGVQATVTQVLSADGEGPYVHDVDEPLTTAYPAGSLVSCRVTSGMMSIPDDVIRQGTVCVATVYMKPEASSSLLAKASVTIPPPAALSPDVETKPAIEPATEPVTGESSSSSAAEQQSAKTPPVPEVARQAEGLTGQEVQNARTSSNSREILPRLNKTDR